MECTLGKPILRVGNQKEGELFFTKTEKYLKGVSKILKKKAWDMKSIQIALFI